MAEIVKTDLEYIYRKLSPDEKKKFKQRTVLVTGCAGFLGFYMMHFLARYSHELSIKRIIGLDNFMLRQPNWLNALANNNTKLEVRSFDVITNAIEDMAHAHEADFIIHMASVASPSFYRKYPVQTLDANVWGLRRLLDFFRDRQIKGFLFMSSSEIYGDPPADCIPTGEEYRGNVSPIGPRACYDEAKRFGETLCYLYAQQYGMPITIVRPFNNFGPGMNLNDRRVPADFARAVMHGEDIVILSDGTPTRTFCYVADAVTGYLQALLYDKFEYFNIGIGKPEISVLRLAEIYKECGERLFNYGGRVLYQESEDKDYLTHTPSRRCPDIRKAQRLLDYKPEIRVEEGVERYLGFLREEGGKR